MNAAHPAKNQPKAENGTRITGKKETSRRRRETAARCDR
nr:MAG TPA: hypothetical protein [Caudoviricetes sp.]